MNHGGAGNADTNGTCWAPSGGGVRQVAFRPQAQQESKWSTSFQNEPLLDAEVKIEDLEKEKQRQLDEAKAARRRQRHKEVVARSRLRHKETAAAIHQQELVLGRKLHELLEQTGHSVTQGSESTVVPSQNFESGASRQQELQHKYAEQVATQERILLENKELRRRIEDHAKLCDAIEKECALSDIATDYGKCVKGVDSMKISVHETSTSGTSSWIFFEGDEDPIYYVPLTEKNCEEIMRAVFQRMLNLYTEFMQRRVPISELEFFGWRVMRPLEVDPRILRFQFTKTVRVVDDSMDAIVNRTWDAFHDPRKFATIYSTPVITRVIQRVTNDMTVLIQNAPVQSGQERNIRYFNILARVRGLNAQNERVVALLKTIVNPSDCQGVGAVMTQLHEIEWMKRGISYLLLTEEPPIALKNEARNIRLHYGCDYECVSEDHARDSGDRRNVLTPRHAGLVGASSILIAEQHTGVCVLSVHLKTRSSHWLLSTAGKWTEEDKKEWKRQQHRENMVFFRRKKKEQQAELRTQHQQLEQRLQQHLAMQRRAAARASQSRRYVSSRDEKHAAVVHLIAETEALKTENVALREQINKHQILRDSVVEAGDGLESDATEPTSSDGSSSDSSLSGGSLSSGSSAGPALSRLISLQRGWRVHFSNGEPSFHFHPFSKEQLDAFRAGYDAKFAVVPPMQSVGTMLGWEVERAPLVPHPTLNVLISRVRYTRRIHCAGGSAHATMDKLDSESWPVLTTPDLWQCIHSSPVTSRVLQMVDEDTYVLVRSTPEPSLGVNVRYLNLVSRRRVQQADGRRLISHAIVVVTSDANKRSREAEPERRDVHWVNEGGAFMSLRQIDDDTLEVVYDHCSGCMNEQHALYCLVDWGHIVIRWEQLVTPSMALTF
ncbi:unnamed protein product [Phytophthora lilii]|uniref:Unnamed protein product n=1 Tax=Phytophthora lilii TaxID=2077276 RepID=A0A9W6YHW0_9STRA|nr:unnamed protein product [Phytophthora lilii]